MIKLSKHKRTISEKAKIRRDILAKLHSQSFSERNKKSRIIKRRLFRDKDFEAAESVMFYVSKDYEVDTRKIIDEALALGKRVIVPVVNTGKKRLILSEITDPKCQLEKRRFGVYEPKKEHIRAVSCKKLDMVIVPGIVFDRRGNRIGHGKGYFDRFLKDLPKKIPTVALAFRFQLVNRLKTLPTDIPVTKIITA